MVVKKHERYKHLCCSIPILGGAIPALAGAITVDADLQRCAVIEIAADRLACYDALTRQLPQTETSPAQVVKAGPVVAETDLQTLAQTPTHDVVSEGQVETVVVTNDVTRPQTISPLSRAWDLERDEPGKVFSLRAYRANYFLPVWYNDHPNANPNTPTRGGAVLYDNEINHIEAKFQISLKTKMWNDVFGSPIDLWFGYTQQSHWQIYNSDWSSPFRDTDYEPEIIATMPVEADLFGLRLRMLGMGVVHQSNGQSDPLSRSWNRVYGMAGFERDNLSLMLRAWYRFSEGNDDNPDITKYMGHGDIQAIYHWNKHTFGLLGRLNASSGKGAIRADWTFPIFGGLRGYVQYFNGYGENLLDYNHHNNSIGVGFIVTDWEGE